ncbi:MoxR family ATPase [uncultured Sphaerotilus sp.]|uniref:AAA family ATPase n=1 Tax=uncultured Sphaerotilus sp. TaxID=474984 RepID=UPI0030CA3809
MTPTIPDYPSDKPIEILEQGTWPASVHLLKSETVAALRAAEAVGRPLLVRGLPGVGKSQTARAAAAHTGRPFLSVVIDGRTEPQDLMWRVDAIKRLSDAQAHRAQAEMHYVQPQVLWWAYQWSSAHQQTVGQCQLPPPHVPPAGWDAEHGRAVLLIDEIDKADPDLPNALLDVLANKGFTPPFAGAGPVRCTDRTRPLIVITTNEERELPAAFLRRCLSITLELPGSEAELRAELVRLGTQHQTHLVKLGRWPGTCRLLEDAADRVIAARKDAVQRGDYLPGTSEYLDLIGALATLYPDDQVKQQQQLDLLTRFIRKSRHAG